MLTNGILSVFLLAIAHSESAAFDKNLIIPPSTYTFLDPSDPASIKIFHRGLRSVGISPGGLTLELLGVRESYFVARYLAQYKNNEDLACTIKFSIGVFSIVRGRFISCTRTLVKDPLEVVTSSTTTSAPTTILPTEVSVVTVATEPAVTAHNADNSIVNMNFEDESTVQPVVGEPKEDKPAGRTAHVSKKNPKKSVRKEESVLRAAAETVQDLVQNLVGQRLTPKKPTGTKQDLPSTTAQSKLSASNLEVETAKSGVRGTVKPSARVGVRENTLKKLCFDGSLFVKTGDKWVLSADGC